MPQIDKTVFEDAYAGKMPGATRAPWDVGGPQDDFVRAADQISGSILDCGCGTGDNALFFAARGNQVTGIDFIEEPIRRAQKKAAERGLSATFKTADALELAKLGQQFDNAIDSGLFHVFNDTDRPNYVAGLAKVVRPGGRVYLMCFSDAEAPGMGPRRVSQAELRAAFADGWTVESITPTQFQIIPELAQMFSSGGPKSWFAVMRKS